MRYSYGISYLRVAATILVVFFHALGYYTYAWPFEGTKVNTYHSFDIVLNQITMPTFFFISAFLFGSKKNNGEYIKTIPFLKNKALRLLVPYLFWSFFQLIVFPNQLSLQSVISGSLHLWFLLVLFLYFTLFQLISLIWLHKKKRILLFILITLVLLSSFGENSIICFCTSSFIHFIPFFFFGILLSNIGADRFSKSKIIVLLLSGLILLVTFSLQMLKVRYIGLLIRECSSLMIIYSLFRIVESFPVIKNETALNIINDLDKNSFGIYILHHIIIWWIVQQGEFRTFLDTHFIIAPICLLFISLFAAWGVSKLIRSNKYIGIILGEHL